MRHFHYLSNQMLQSIFYASPIEWTKESLKDFLAYTLGGTLYTPGTRSQISNDILNGKFREGKYAGLTSFVICLEDSISDPDVERAEMNCVVQIQSIYHSLSNRQISMDDLPLIFIRVRHPKQIKKMIVELGDASQILSGFVLPKFHHVAGEEYLNQIAEVNDKNNLKLYALPIIETKEVIYKESRDESLLSIRSLLDQYYELILNVRIGATDFSGLFGIRRSRDTTVYDIAVIQDCLSDILNIFGRMDREYIVSGPVWEYFNASRILRPYQESVNFDLTKPFDEAIIKEILLDKKNGIVGKTIIHPSHIKIVNALNTVTYEEYLDALSIIENYDSHNGVIRSQFNNKMNEVKPHYHWARKVLLKSRAYGVLHEQQSFIELLRVNERVHI